MIRKGFIRDNTGAWTNLDQIAEIFACKTGISASFTDTDIDNIILLEHHESHDGDNQTWLDKIMCGEV